MQTTFDTIQQLLSEKERILGRISRLASGADRARLQARSANGAWSAEEILEHLSIVESGLLRLIESLLKKAESSPGVSTPSTPLSLESLGRRVGSEKFKTLERYEPTGNIDSRESLQALQRLQDQLFALKQRLESADLARVSFPHWIFGSLTLGQWLAFFVVHEQRHAEQIASLLAHGSP
jgi:uncharacterized damage-inducible protein DinB